MQKSTLSLQSKMLPCSVMATAFFSGLILKYYFFGSSMAYAMTMA